VIYSYEYTRKLSDKGDVVLRDVKLRLFSFRDPVFEMIEREMFLSAVDRGRNRHDDDVKNWKSLYDDPGYSFAIIQL